MNFKHLWDTYKDLIPYAFFGVCTTGVNVIFYWLFAHVLGQGIMLSTITAWILAVLFAYFTNKKCVFHSRAKSTGDIAKELFYFFGCRIATGVLDWACMYVFVTLLGCNDVLVKVASNILVIILNYVASKFLIFREEMWNVK